jgi:flagellar hook-basal body complex protein FliE
MNIEAVNAVNLLDGPAITPGAAGPAPASFGQHVMREINQLNTEMPDTERLTRQFAAGEGVPLHTLMIKLEEARIGFQALVQVRNKVLEAYQDVMRMQV